MLDMIILGMVTDEALTGYDIKKFIENGIGVFYKASYGSLYPSLKKLTDKGYLTMLENLKGGRQKFFYKTTEPGREIFYKWLKEPVSISDGHTSHLVKVYFFDKLSEDIRDRLLYEYELNNINYLKKLLSLEEHFHEIENKECYYYKLSTLYYGISIVQDNITWCRHIRERKPLRDLIKQRIEMENNEGLETEI